MLCALGNFLVPADDVISAIRAIRLPNTATRAVGFEQNSLEWVGRANSLNDECLMCGAINIEDHLAFNLHFAYDLVMLAAPCMK